MAEAQKRGFKPTIFLGSDWWHNTIVFATELEAKQYASAILLDLGLKSVELRAMVNEGLVVLHPQHGFFKGDRT